MEKFRGGRTAAPCPLLHNRETTQLVATPYETGTSTRCNLAKIFLGLCLFLGIFRCFSIPYDILQVGTRLRNQSIIQRAAANTCDQTQGADCQSEASWLARRNSAEDALLEISRANALAPDAFWAAARRAHMATSTTGAAHPDKATVTNNSMIAINVFNGIFPLCSSTRLLQRLRTCKYP